MHANYGKDFEKCMPFTITLKGFWLIYNRLHIVHISFSPSPFFLPCFCCVVFCNEIINYLTKKRCYITIELRTLKISEWVFWLVFWASKGVV